MKNQLIFLIIIFILFCFLIPNCSNNKEIHIIKPTPILTLGKVDDPHEAFHYPTDLTVDSKGNIYVLDSGNNRIVKFNENGKFLLEFGRFGQGPGEFSNPVDILIDGEDKIYVLETGNSRVQIFDTLGHRIGGFAPERLIHLSFAQMAVDSRKRIYINYPHDGKLIDVYSKEGKFINSIGDYINLNKKKSASKDNITYINFDDNDNLYVLFQSRPIIRKYDKEYKLIYQRDISNLPEVQESLKRIRENKKRMPTMIHSMFGHGGICVFPNGEYIIHSGRLYHFNSDGFPIKKIDFHAYYGVNVFEKYLYKIDLDNDSGIWVVRKYLLS